MERIPFQYVEFSDVPRCITFEFGGAWYFLDSSFDEEKDDYPDHYNVFRLPDPAEDLWGSVKTHPNFWAELDRTDHLGTIPIAKIGLDESRRKSIDARAFSNWLAQRGD